MRTTKPISTISFNTPEYLELKLDELVKARKIAFYAFVPHLPEDDEGGKKHHSHVYLEPSKLLQTEDIRDLLLEYDPSQPSKPLGCLPFHTSIFSHWYLYGKHDKAYLAMKGESRRYHYTDDDIRSSDPDYMIYLVKSIDILELSPYQAMLDAISSGVTWNEYFARGSTPIPQINAYEKAWSLLVAHHTSRGSHEPHDMNIDQETGELIEGDITDVQ